MTGSGLPRRIVLTGGPGSGKSTLIAHLAEAGFRTSEEAGRRVIREELASGGDALPWGDRLAFAERMLELDVAAHAAAEGAYGPTVFDRGAPDVVGYLDLCGLAVPDRIAAEAARLRYDLVFIAPFWPEIFVNDAERRQTPEEARLTAETMARTYARFGYEVVTLPKAPVAERAAMVVTAIRGQA